MQNCKGKRIENSITSTLINNTSGKFLATFLHLKTLYSVCVLASYQRSKTFFQSFSQVLYLASIFEAAGALAKNGLSLKPKRGIKI
jgi:hypothetical protein